VAPSTPQGSAQADAYVHAHTDNQRDLLISPTALEACRHSSVRCSTPASPNDLKRRSARPLADSTAEKIQLLYPRECAHLVQPLQKQQLGTAFIGMHVARPDGLYNQTKPKCKHHSYSQIVQTQAPITLATGYDRNHTTQGSRFALLWTTVVLWITGSILAYQEDMLNGTQVHTCCLNTQTSTCKPQSTQPRAKGCLSGNPQLHDTAACILRADVVHKKPNNARKVLITITELLDAASRWHNAGLYALPSLHVYHPKQTGPDGYGHYVDHKHASQSKDRIHVL